MQYKSSINIFFKAVVLMIFLNSCDKGRNEAGHEFYPDMVYSRAYETYSPNGVFDDDMGQRLPVEGTKSRGHLSFRYDVLPDNRLLAGQTLKSADKLNMKYVFEGKKLYKEFCYVCHGISGKGNGYLAKSGKLPVQPQDLTQERLKNASKGELFHVITMGSGLMGAQGAQISERDRWKIVEFIKVKFHKQKVGAGGMAAVSTRESYADFEKRIAKYSKSKGLGPIKNLKLGALNTAMANKGKALFKAKCSSCHKPMKKYIGPAPKGITKKRTPEWIMNIILNPKQMLNEDPMAKELLKRYLSPMANQNLSKEEARQVLEYFRTLN